MASPRSYPNGLFTAVVILIFSLTLLASRPVGLVFSKFGETFHRQRKLAVLGSRPPMCVNKCLSCRPCMATLVIPPHRSTSTLLSKEEKDEGYYLLSWKCRCGDKLFQP